MKNHTLALFASASLLMLLFTGCLDEKVKTTINADGSSERTITMNLQSKSVPEKAFPVASNGWSVEWRVNSDTSAPYQYIAKKSFSTPEELHAEYAADEASRAMRINVSVEKRFRWFFTYIEYREVYAYRNPYGHVPIGNYLTPAEITAYQHSEKNDTLQSKVDLWLMRDKFEDGYALLVNGAEKLNDPALPVSFLRDNKEHCFAALLSEDTTGKSKTKSDTTIKSDSTKNISSEEFIRDILSKVLGTEAVTKLHASITDADKILTAKEEMTKFPDSWEYTTIMPGLLLEANSPTIQGNMVTWKFNPDQAKVANFEMFASSRVANTWAFILSAGLVLLLVLLSLIPLLRKRRKGIVL